MDKEKIKIAFWDNCLCERGTTIRVTNYAFYNQKILGNDSIIMYFKNSPNNVGSVIDKLSQEFKVYGVSNFSEVDSILQKEQCDIFYITKSGENDGKISKVCKNIVHCVFNCYQPHGDVYASIAEGVKGNNSKYPVVPGHMIRLSDTTENMRSGLGIPEDAVVFGRYGGKETFDIHFVQKIVTKVAKENSKIFFLFANTKTFCESLPNIIHLPCIIDLDDKTRFINTCDAMLHARIDGETFGAAIAEFSSKNKPILTTKVGNLCHLDILKEKCILYDEQTLENIILSFNKEEIIKRDWNAYLDFTPENIMKKFNEIFIGNYQKNMKFIYQSLTYLSENLKNKIINIRKNGGLMSYNQYATIAQFIEKSSPCNLLVFGLGNDSYLWNELNVGGQTIFLENFNDWISNFPNLNVFPVTYTTLINQAFKLSEDELKIDLPQEVTESKWDIIIIDAPVGHPNGCNCYMCPAPGRMQSIYMGYHLCKEGGFVFIDDIDRKVEREYSLQYFKKENLIKQVDQMYIFIKK